MTSKKDDFSHFQQQFYEFVNTTSPVSESSWEKVCEIMRYRRVEKRSMLLAYMEGEQVLRYLCKGIVKCEDHFNDKSYVIDFRVAPIILCETFSFFNGRPYRITLEAATDCEFIELPREPFLNLLFSNFDLAQFATCGIANYLAMINHKMALLITLSAEQRYKQFLRELPLVARYCSLKDIASYLNIEQSTLSRIRKTIRWAEDEKELEILSNELDMIFNFPLT